MKNIRPHFARLCFAVFFGFYPGAVADVLAASDTEDGRTAGNTPPCGGFLYRHHANSDLTRLTAYARTYMELPGLHAGFPLFLYGCRPGKILMNDGRLNEHFIIDYNKNGRVQKYKRLRVVDGQIKKSYFENTFDARERLTASARDCKLKGKITETFRYDRLGRLVHHQINVPAACYRENQDDRDRIIKYRYYYIDESPRVSGLYRNSSGEESEQAWEYKYDEQGRLSRLSYLFLSGRPRIKLTGKEQKRAVSYFTYDNQGELVRYDYNFNGGASLRFKYRQGRMVRITKYALESQKPLGSTSIRYDRRLRPIKVITRDPRGKIGRKYLIFYPRKK